MNKPIESGMDFSPLFEAGKAFYLEKSTLLSSLGAGVRTVEFLMLPTDKLMYIVEAKSSSPKPTPDNTVKLDEFFNEISEKFLHSFDLYMSTYLGLQAKNDNDIPDYILAKKPSELKIKLVLVINGHHETWLSPILDGLNKKLLAKRKIWKVEIAVLNDSMAREMALITA